MGCGRTKNTACCAKVFCWPSSNSLAIAQNSEWARERGGEITVWKVPRVTHPGRALSGPATLKTVSLIGESIHGSRRPRSLLHVRGGTRILVRGPAEFWPLGGLSPKCAQNTGFSLKLPENCKTSSLMTTRSFLSGARRRETRERGDSCQNM